MEKSEVYDIAKYANSCLKGIPIPSDLPEKYSKIVNDIFSDIETMVQYGLNMGLDEVDQKNMINLLEAYIRKDPGTKIFSVKMRNRLALKRFHYVQKKSNVFFNFVVGKRRKTTITNFLKTLTMPCDKGQLHFISGSNFTICAVSHFFDRFIQRNELDLSRPHTMDLIYRRLMQKPIKVTYGQIDDFFKLNEGIAIGKSFGKEHRVFIFMTYITDEQLTDKQLNFMREFEEFQPKLRNILI